MQQVDAVFILIDRSLRKACRSMKTAWHRLTASPSKVLARLTVTQRLSFGDSGCSAGFKVAHFIVNRPKCMWQHAGLHQLQLWRMSGWSRSCSNCASHDFCGEHPGVHEAQAPSPRGTASRTESRGIKAITTSSCASPYLSLMHVRDGPRYANLVTPDDMRLPLVLPLLRVSYADLCFRSPCSL